jgi:hypothetical protein
MHLREKVLARNRPCAVIHKIDPQDMKKSFAIILCALFFSNLALDSGAATAVTNAPAKGSEPAKKGRGLPFHGNVAAIDTRARTVTMEGKKQRMFRITPDTKIHKDKKETTLAALAVGDYVGGYARETADGKLELVTLNIGAAPGKSKPAPKAAR